MYFFEVFTVTLPVLDDKALVVLLILYPVLLAARLLFRIKDTIQF